MLQNTLTHVEDTDVKILYPLDLKDFRRICSVDKYAYHLCHNNVILKNKMNNAINRVNNIINKLPNLKKNGIILQPNDEFTIFNNFHNIMKRIMIDEPPNEDDENDLNP